MSNRETLRASAMFLTHLECTGCGSVHSADALHALCSVCGRILFARYDLARLKQELDRKDLLGGPWNLWRYREFLPVAPQSIISLGEGMTPLLRVPGLRSLFGVAQLWIKDESLNPTGTFKARGMTVAVSKAKELGVKTLVVPSAGNAGAALAAYGSRAGIEVNIVIPKATPEAIRAECQMYGARVYEVEGSISDAGDYVGELRENNGAWFDMSTLKEPYRVEGKKTLGLELAEQLGWNLPDVIVFPTGGGTGLIGMWKAFEELEVMGWIGSRRPRMVAVQAAGCAPIVRAFERGASFSERWENARTIAAGLRVPKALGDYLILDAVRRSEGTCVAVTDEEILASMRLVARVEGILPCPEGAATVAALSRLKEEGFVGPDDSVALFNTGSGLKYVELLHRAVA